MENSNHFTEADRVEPILTFIQFSCSFIRFPFGRNCVFFFGLFAVNLDIPRTIIW